MNAELIQKMINYIQSKPYNEVWQLMTEIREALESMNTQKESIEKIEEIQEDSVEEEA